MTCGRRDTEVGVISWRGNCETCGIERMVQATYELRDRRGPMFRRWQARLIEGVQRAALDAPAQRP